MRGLSTFLIASTFLVLGLTAPTGGLEDHGLSILEDRADNPSTPQRPSQSKPIPPAVGKGNPRNPFPLDAIIKEWFEDEDRVQDTLKYAAEFTKGGYEGWVQVEWDHAAKGYKTVKIEPSDREVPVYVEPEEAKTDKSKEKRADFVFEPTETTKGMIVELKTENMKSQGATFVSQVKKDVHKLGGPYRTPYTSNDYEKVAIAIAWSEQAHSAFKTEDFKEMAALRGVETELSGGQTLKIYRMDVEPKTTTDPVKEVTDKFATTGFEDSDSDCEQKQKRSSPECQRKTSSNSPSTNKDKTGTPAKTGTKGTQVNKDKVNKGKVNKGKVNKGKVNKGKVNKGKVTAGKQ